MKNDMKEKRKTVAARIDTTLPRLWDRTQFFTCSSRKVSVKFPPITLFIATNLSACHFASSESLAVMSTEKFVRKSSLRKNLYEKVCTKKFVQKTGFYPHLLHTKTFSPFSTHWIGKPCTNEQATRNALYKKAPKKHFDYFFIQFCKHVRMVMHEKNPCSIPFPNWRKRLDCFSANLCL